MLLLCFTALLTVNGIYATDENQNISNISENTTIQISNSTTASVSETSIDENISSGNDTANNANNVNANNVNNVAENEIGNNTTEDVTSTPSNQTGAAGSDTIAGSNFTIEEILEAAETIKKYIEANKALPTTVTIGTTKLNMAQFLYLATTATTLLNNGKPTTTTINV
ncbi:pseudomurein-binding repeat-containing protein, partial [Methanobacterium sp.]|uniref:pseudomurein-binding repeat-containing protein n=1 Tax=Methanobacterium sp. TaxID=2164 RepID=UPI0025EAD3FA